MMEVLGRQIHLRGQSDFSLTNLGTVVSRNEHVEVAIGQHQPLPRCSAGERLQRFGRLRRRAGAFFQLAALGGFNGWLAW